VGVDEKRLPSAHNELHRRPPRAGREITAFRPERRLAAIEAGGKSHAPDTPNGVESLTNDLTVAALIEADSHVSQLMP
jgi:hypothetical protein